MVTTLKLELFVAGNSPASRRARTELDSWCAAVVGTAVEVEVIDVFEQPERALAAEVWLTPQLIVEGEFGRSVIVGDLTRSGGLGELLPVATRSA